MDEVKPLLDSIFRWLHVFAGIMWIGLLYFFNFINGAVGKTFDADSKKKVVPELMPRTLYWFRWGAAWTWITGFFLVLLLYYHGKLVLADPTAGFTGGTIAMMVATFALVIVYDLLYKAMGHTPVSITIGFVLIAGAVAAMYYVGGFGYRGYMIHTGAMFGTMMAFNVWFRIWPAQQKVIPAIKNGEAPDGDAAALAGMRSKHNTYLSMPLIWAMLNAHTTTIPAKIGLPDDLAWVGMLIFTLVGWGIINVCYRKSAKVPGM